MVRLENLREKSGTMLQLGLNAGEWDVLGMFPCGTIYLRFFYKFTALTWDIFWKTHKLKKYNCWKQWVWNLSSG